MSANVRQISRKIRRFRYEIPAEDTRTHNNGTPLCSGNTYGNGFEIVVTEVDEKTRRDTAGIEIFVIGRNPRDTIDLGRDGRQNLSNLNLPDVYKAKIYPIIDAQTTLDEEHDKISEHVENLPGILRAMAAKIEELIAEQTARSPSAAPPAEV